MKFNIKQYCLSSKKLLLILWVLGSVSLLICSSLSFQLRLCLDKSGWISGISTHLEVFDFWKLASSSQKQSGAQVLKSGNPAVPLYRLQALQLKVSYLSLCSPVTYEIGIIIDSTSWAYGIKGDNVYKVLSVIQSTELNILVVEFMTS